MKTFIPAVIAVFFCCCSVDAENPVEPWDVQSDTWTATDDLGRTLPDAAEVGTPKKDKFIGMFYFLWSGRHGEQGPFDISKILAADPNAVQNADSPLWGPKYAPHHWGESVFNYYVSDDDYVLRKHAQMLSDAGVDVIIFDVTNQLTYPESYPALCRVFREMRNAGNQTPQIAFLTPFWKPRDVVQKLWNDLYGKGEYSELWFRWKGKPLILADPELVGTDHELTYKTEIPAAATPDHSVGQSFVSNVPFRKVSIPIPTWATADSAATLALYEEKPGGKEILSQKFTNLSDNAWVSLTPEKPLPSGKYYLELRHEYGKPGWWSMAESGKIPGGEAFLNGKPCQGTRSLRLAADPDPNSETAKILNFFTFRKPQADYFVGPTGPDQWSWLEVYPQHGFYTSANQPEADGKPKKVEQVSVGIGQNAVDGKLGVLSNPRSHGRSFHNGKQPPPEQCDFTGKNYTEQWNRAFELDPEFVFITGWNEWIAGRFPREATFSGASEQAVNFVDQFNREYSRDIEPMQGGHGDTFYYQMIAYNRKFKGVRAVEPVRAQPITVDGNFDDWKDVTPEFRDTIGDAAKRNYRGWGKDSKYVNETGRNDLIATKVSFDAQKKSLSFYVRTQAPIIGNGEPNWMILYLDIDADPKTGWLGYDYCVSEKSLLRYEKDGWKKLKPIDGIFHNNEYELSIPFDSLGLNSLPKTILFKWADGIKQTGEWSDFTLNGDVAPNDRYNYKAGLF